MSEAMSCGCEVYVYGGHGMATSYELHHAIECTSIKATTALFAEQIASLKSQLESVRGVRDELQDKMSVVLAVLNRPGLEVTGIDAATTLGQIKQYFKDYPELLASPCPTVAPGQGATP